MQWKWVGHTLRSSAAALVKPFFADGCHSDVNAYGLRRARTGPDNTGMRPVAKFLQSRGLDLEFVRDRAQWASLLPQYRAYWGVNAREPGGNVQLCSPELMSWEVRCLQGTVHGSITVFVRYSETCGMMQLAQLRRVEGWVLHQAGMRSVVADAGSFLGEAWNLVVGELLPAVMTDCTRHVRLHWDGLSNSALRLLPNTCQALWMKRVVIEVSEMACDLAPGVIWAA